MKQEGEAPLISNIGTTDDILSEIARIAIQLNDEEILEEISHHPNVGPKTSEIIENVKIQI